jgi:dsDNA-specific endonuclease/ATPase MutS2
MMYDKNSIEKSYAVMKEFYEVVKNDENKNIVQSLQFKLCNLKDINHTISRLATSVVIDDIELYEVKSLALLSADVKNILEKIYLDKIIKIPDLDEVVKILDPDGLRIATFYIYDSYSEELASLRKKLKEKDVYQEEIYNEVMRIEDEIRAELSSKLKPYSEAMISALNALADVDINIAKSLQMKELGLCFPTISLKNISSYKGIFHPEVKSILEKEKREDQKVDIDFGLKPLIIMGSNMGGKTIVLKTLAMCQYLLQFGFGVPAISADMMIYDEIFCLTTDDQSINKGLSSFAAEMKNIDAVIKSSRTDAKCCVSTLALIDEPARTTNPTEGTALVSSLVKLLQDIEMSLVIVTHYNIKTYNNKCLRVKGLIDGKMNYELVETHEGEVPHEALNIAETLGIDSRWIEMAKEIISDRS